MRPAQRVLTKTAVEVGGFDKVIAFSPQDLDSNFVRKNERVLKQGRGVGYWLWKPYIIQKTLAALGPDDVLFYCDAGAFFIQPIDPYMEIMYKTGQSLIPFFIPHHIEKHWTKRDAFILMDCDTPAYSHTQQRIGGVHLWRRSAFTLRFVAEWLRYTEDRRIITDMPNQYGQPNYPDFREHRHDQSILSLLTKKYGLTAYKPPYLELEGRERMTIHIRTLKTYSIDSHKDPSKVLVMTRHKGLLPVKILRSYDMAPQGVIASFRYRIAYGCNVLWLQYVLRPQKFFLYRIVPRIKLLIFLYRKYLIRRFS